MLILPIESDDHTCDCLIVILDDTSIERMREADPAEVVLQGCGKNLVNPVVLICYEETTPELLSIIKCGDLQKIVAYLRRGFRFRPDLGDHDRGPKKLNEEEEK